MAAYEPELGQMLFGQPTQQFACPMLMEAVLDYISNELNRVQWNIHQKEMPSPFGNTGASFSNEVFAVEAYSWGEEEQPWNFKWGDLEISWYKWAGRGMSANKEITPELCAECLAACVASLHAMDDPA